MSDVNQFKFPRTWSLQQRIDHKTDRSGGPNACWPWLGSRTKHGYATIIWKGKLRRVSRLICSTPDGEHAMHSCDNPPCVNPDHISNGGPAANVADKVAKNRQAKGERSGPAILTESQVREIRAKYIPRKYSRRRLAREYGVAHGTIWYVTTGQNWKHVQ